MLAVATFAVRPVGSRVTRVVEQALQVNQWPLLMPSRLNDLMQKIFFSH